MTEEAAEAAEAEEEFLMQCLVGTFQWQHVWRMFIVA